MATLLEEVSHNFINTHHMSSTVFADSAGGVCYRLWQVRINLNRGQPPLIASHVGTNYKPLIMFIACYNPHALQCKCRMSNVKQLRDTNAIICS